MAQKQKPRNEKPGSFDRIKQHRGGGYSGMQVGRSHKWDYDQGEWRERKLTPDEWEIFYQTTKRRAAKAPEGSGAPIGTEYNWLIVAHQRVDKLDENSYMTCMEGKKFKVAHKRASKDQWSATEATQRRHVIQFLEQVTEELKHAEAGEQLPYTVGERDRIYGLNLRTKAELSEMAREFGIAGISKMKRDELLATVKEHLGQAAQTRGQGERGLGEKISPSTRPQPDSRQAGAKDRAKDGDGHGDGRLQDKTRRDLYQIASERDIAGRSEMNKAELLTAVKKDMGQAHGRAH